MVACQGYGCLARSLEQQDTREVQQERAEAKRDGGAALPLVAPVVSAVATPTLGIFAGTPLDIIRAALEPWRRGSAS